MTQQPPSRRLFLRAGLAASAAAAVPSLLSACAQRATATTPASAPPAAPAAAADLGTPVFPAQGFRRLRLGDIEIVALLDGISRRPLAEGFVTNASLAQVQAQLAAQGLPTTHLDISYTPFLVIAGGRRMLMDTGIGEFGGPTAGRLLQQLQAAGVQPADIDTVLITHFHGDHINGLRSRAGAWNFPNARVLVPAPEHAYWMSDASLAAAPQRKAAFDTARRVFADFPADRLVRFDPGAEVAPGVRSVAAFGHTPGHTVFEVGSGAQRFAYVGDLTNLPALFVRNPDWAVMFDMDAEAARQTRRQVLQRLAQEGTTVGGFHFPFPAFGRIARAGEGFEFRPAG